ncbi:MAG: L-histidine N(alpha)-methyltransferase [Tahibacter sp.]
MIDPHRYAADASLLRQFAQDVQAGLCRAEQKTLPPKYFYDDLGSLLFDAITLLPEYGLTRAEHRVLQKNAVEIAASAQASLVIELGSGTASKTRCVLEALLRHRPVTYGAVEISPSALRIARHSLEDLPGLRMHGYAEDYLDGLASALRLRAPGDYVLVLFLGSSLGNFDSAEGGRFLSRLRRALRHGDSVLLGNDLLKTESVMLAAYDDALGVTAAFNRNLLLRMNRELGTDFMLSRFQHSARFDAGKGNIEMHLVSRCDQIVHLRDPAMTVTLRQGESIHTENSHKYSLSEIDELAHSSGFEVRQRWCDIEWPFASSLLVAT